jgi:hypothetical protein
VSALIYFHLTFAEPKLAKVVPVTDKRIERIFRICMIMGLLLLVIGIIAKIFDLRMVGEVPSRSGGKTGVNTSGNGVIIIGLIMLLAGMYIQSPSRKSKEN